jgi:type II secretory pathway pseudopilin PulG
MIHRSANSWKHRTWLSPGFSLPEVLIAALILMIILAAVVESQLNSLRTIEKSGQRHAVLAKINEDLNMLRSQSNRWQCVNGTACSGLAADQDIPRRFNLNHCQLNNPLEDYPIEDASLEASSGGIIIERVMSIAPSHRRLDVSYTSEVGGKAISTNSTIVPEALKWCG